MELQKDVSAHKVQIQVNDTFSSLINDFFFFLSYSVLMGGRHRFLGRCPRKSCMSQVVFLQHTVSKQGELQLYRFLSGTLSSPSFKNVTTLHSEGHKHRYNRDGSGDKLKYTSASLS